MDNYVVEHINVRPNEIVVLRYDMDKVGKDDVVEALEILNQENREFPSNVLALPNALSIETMTIDDILEIIENLNKFVETLKLEDK